jgi:glycolate oxidase
LALETVLPNGQIVNLGAKTQKSVAGYNLVELMVGSEGTLGVISKITLRLIPKPEGRYAIFVLFDKLDQAALTVSKIIKEKIIPSALEFLDKNALECVKNYLNIPLSESIQSMLLIEVDGEKILLDSQLKKISEVCLSCGALTLEEAKTEEEIEKIWSARRSISPALSKLGPTKVSEDIVVPRSKLKEIVLALEAIRNKYKINLVAFGHAGDGNIHVTIQTDRRKPEEIERVEKAVEEVMKATLSLGGSISGEHGIGLTKKKFLPWEVGQAELQLMRQLKNSLDPNNILNPGKIF